MNEKFKKLKNSLASFREKATKKLEKPTKVCKIIFGYGIMLSLFAGALTFFGYLLAICVGGDFAVQICATIKTHIIPVITYSSTIMVLFGLIIMYMSGQVALTAKKSPKLSHDEGEK